MKTNANFGITGHPFSTGYGYLQREGYSTSSEAKAALIWMTLGLKPAHLQLNSTEEGAKESDHTQEFHSTQISDNILFTNIWDAV